MLQDCGVPGIRLRGFRKHDLVQLYELDQLCFPADIAYSMSDLRYFLNNARCFSLVAEGPKATVAGFTIVERVRRRGKMTGHIVTIDVGPWMRRKGLGRLLLGAAEEQLKREGAALLTLEVAEDNLGAQAFYHQSGFTDTGRIPDYYAGRLDAQVMEKSI
jgi:[ribosomal protein S18]-alanine N-acetyltransferase